MSRIDDLIQAHCPEGVVFSRVGDVSSIVRGERVTKRDLIEDGSYPVVSGGTGFMGRLDKWNREAGSITVAQYGTAGYVKWQPDRFWANDVCFTVVPALDMVDARYLYYLLVNKQQVLYELSNRNAVPFSIEREKVLDVRIPVPPMEVQKEIVRILDTFSQLEAELEAELEARRKQYTFYRDQLLSFRERDGIRWAKLNEIGEFVRGKGVQKADLTNAGVPAIHYGQVHTHYGAWAEETKSFVRPDVAGSLRFARPGDLVLATTSEDDDGVAKAVAWLGTQNAAVSSDAYIFRHRLCPKFVAYYFQTPSFDAQKRTRITGTKVRRISGESMGEITIPVPPLEEQERIVAILDRFDALVNDLSSGLPAELKARRQQYEHYRDRLLTFKEAK